jgi:predicted metalloprotease with PDZ domain
MQDELLWVYEGLTQYYGRVLATRSGLYTPEVYRDRLALVAAYFEHESGRLWRPLIDTAVASQILRNAGPEWSAERRGQDYYGEGSLIWLEADTLIRQLSSGQRSLDDFCRRFFGGQSGPAEVKPYTFDDVVATLNEVAPSDWASFFKQRLYATDAHAPLGGIDGGGWRVTYNGEPSDVDEALNALSNSVGGLWYSLGLGLKSDGAITDVDLAPGMPAADAKLSPGMKVVAVDGKAFSPDVLGDELKAATTAKQPIQLLVDSDGTLRTYALDPHGGQQYAHLERDSSKPDLLSQIVAPLTAK